MSAEEKENYVSARFQKKSVNIFCVCCMLLLALRRLKFPEDKILDTILLLAVMNKHSQHIPTLEIFCTFRTALQVVPNDVHHYQIASSLTDFFCHIQNNFLNFKCLLMCVFTTHMYIYTSLCLKVSKELTFKSAEMISSVWEH